MRRARPASASQWVDEAIILEPLYDMYAPQVGFTGAQANYVTLERAPRNTVLERAPRDTVLERAPGNTVFERKAGPWRLNLETLRNACSDRVESKTKGVTTLLQAAPAHDSVARRARANLRSVPPDPALFARV